MKGVLKTTLVWCQNYGILYPSIKVFTFLLALIGMMYGGGYSIQQSFRIIGWMHYLGDLLLEQIPPGIQILAMALASISRVQVKCIVCFEENS